MSPTRPMIVRTTPLADERLAADALDPLDDAGDVLVGGVGCHDDDHGGVPLGVCVVPLAPAVAPGAPRETPLPDGQGRWCRCAGTT